mmetsp:Transcript_54143/g.121701  ORF Transcript_54143/g.121701 Transcript_54143/m.121701 type:complete len:777 (-) Transcript_54143:148-2478(-)
MAPFTIQDLYASKVKSQEELQAAIDAAAQAKAGSERAAALLAAADAHLQQEDKERALQDVREALVVCRDAGAEELEALTLCLLAKVRIGGAFNLEALQAANRAKRTFKELGDKTGEAAALYVMSEVHAATPSPEDAAWKAAEAEKIFNQLGDKAGRAAALCTMAESYAMAGQFKKGSQAASDAKAAFSELGNQLKEGSILCLQAKMHLGLGELDMAMQVGKDAMAMLDKAGGSTEEVLDVLIRVFTQRGEFEDAVFVAQQEADRCKTKGDIAAEANVLCKIADVHLSIKEYVQASSCLADATSLYKMAGDKKGEARSTLAHAQVKLDQRSIKDARQLVDSATGMFLLLGEEELDGLLRCYECSAILTVTGSGVNFSEAFNYLIAKMNDFKERGIPTGEGVMLVAISDMQIRIKDTAGALNTLEAATPLLLQGRDRRREAGAWVKLSEMHAQKGAGRPALKAAEEAVAIYRKLAAQKDLASASLLLAAAHFALSSKGNGRDALRAAEEAVSIYKTLGDKASQASALNVLANAQLMNQSFAEAKNTARSAESIFVELGDTNGQANALLMVAGAILGSGDFAEAKDVAKEAREHFRDIGAGKGEDSAEDFLDAIKSYEGGSLDRSDFMGFTMSAPQPDERKVGKKVDPKKKDRALPTDVDVYNFGPKGEKQTVTYFDAFEPRRATAPTRGKAARRASAEAAAAEAEDSRLKKDQALFAVRWVPDDGASEEKKQEPSELEVEDRRIHLAMNLGQPSAKFPGHCGKTERMFFGMGMQKGLA